MGALVGALTVVTVVPADAGLLPPILGGGQPAPAAGPLPLAGFWAAAAPGDEAIEMGWQYAAGGPRAEAVRILLFEVREDGTQVEVNSALVRRGLLPDTYRVAVEAGRWRVSAAPESASAGGARSFSPIITVASRCSGAAICAEVGTQLAPKVSLVGQGLLLGLVDDQGRVPSPSLVAPLRVKQWRFAFRDADAVARTYQVSRTQVLSELWTDATAPSNGGYARTPWSDWNRFGSFVVSVVSKAKAEGWSPDYWDIWNEPNGTCCPKFSPRDQRTMTVDRWLWTYDAAYRAIKSVDPNAKIIGPSTSVLRWVPDASLPEFDLDTFLRFSAGRGLVWDAISWHEIGGFELESDVTNTILNIDRHVALAKALMAKYPGTVVGNRVFINEYTHARTHLLAGWAVGWFRAFEDSGVAQANRACFSSYECESTVLNGLLTAANEPTAAWWVHRLYADLADAPRVPVTSSSSWQLDGLASRDDASRTVRALLGRHWSCNPGANAWCKEYLGIRPASVQVSIAWPYGNQPVTVTTSLLPAGTAALTAPYSSTQTLYPAAGKIVVAVPSLSDGSAISLVARPAG